MAPKATLITSRSKKGLQTVRFFEDAYNKAKLDAARAQVLNEKGGEFQSGILALIAKLAPIQATTPCVGARPQRSCRRAPCP